MVKATNSRQRSASEIGQSVESAGHFYSASADGIEARERLLRVLKESLTHTYTASDAPQERLERLNHLINDLVDEVIRLQSALEEKEPNSPGRYSEQKRNHWLIGLALSVTTLFSILAASLLLKPDDIGGRFATYFFAGVTGSASAEAFRQSLKSESE